MASSSASALCLASSMVRICFNWRSRLCSLAPIPSTAARLAMTDTAECAYRAVGGFGPGLRQASRSDHPDVAAGLGDAWPAETRRERASAGAGRPSIGFWLIRRLRPLVVGGGASASTRPCAARCRSAHSMTGTTLRPGDGPGCVGPEPTTTPAPELGARKMSSGTCATVRPETAACVFGNNLRRGNPGGQNCMPVHSQGLGWRNPS